MSQKKILVAFSGGLDTTYCVVYLKQLGYKVSTATVNTGGFSKEEEGKIEEWSYKLGSEKHYNIDAKESLFEKLICPLIKANYLRNGTYPPCVGPERYIIVEEIAKIVKNEKFDAIAHGSTGAGGDQVRFESGLYTILPGVELVAPIRDNSLSRDATFKYLQEKGIEIQNSRKDYSINIGVIGNTIGGKETLDTKEPLPDYAFPNNCEINESESKITIGFEKGIPVSLNGSKISGSGLMIELNKTGYSYGYGRGYHIGTSILGIKARLGFEAAAYKMLIFAHSELEKVVLTSKQTFWKNHLGNLYGDMIHEGHYYEPLLNDIVAMVNSANEFVTGDVTLLIRNGNVEIYSIESKYSLFNKKVATYGETMSAWTGEDAKSFGKLYSFEARNAYWIRNK